MARKADSTNLNQYEVKPPPKQKGTHGGGGRNQGRKEAKVKTAQLNLRVPASMKKELKILVKRYIKENDALYVYWKGNPDITAKEIADLFKRREITVKNFFEKIGITLKEKEPDVISGS